MCELKAFNFLRIKLFNVLILLILDDKSISVTLSPSVWILLENIFPILISHSADCQKVNNNSSYWFLVTCSIELQVTELIKSIIAEIRKPNLNKRYQMDVKAIANL